MGGDGEDDDLGPRYDVLQVGRNRDRIRKLYPWQVFGILALPLHLLGQLLFNRPQPDYIGVVRCQQRESGSSISCSKYRNRISHISVPLWNALDSKAGQ